MLEQNVENRDCMYKYDEPFKKMIKTTNKNMDNLNDSESKINQTGRKTEVNSFWNLKNVTSYTCVPAKNTKTCRSCLRRSQ